MSYVDGFVAAVPTAKREEYLAHCKSVGAIFKEHGALEVADCWGDDVPQGKLTSFPMAVKCGDDETVAFGWIVWPSRAVRDTAWAAVMADPRMKDMQPVFDGKRMIYGGFETLSKV